MNAKVWHIGNSRLVSERGVKCLQSDRGFLGPKNDLQVSSRVSSARWMIIVMAKYSY